MPFDANGNYTLPAIYKATAGQTIYATQHNTPLEDIQAALNAALIRDGRVAWTGNQNANGYKLTGLADGVDDQDAATTAQVTAAVSASQDLCLLLASTALQTVSSDVTFTGTIIVPTVTDFTAENALGAKTAEGRYAKPSDIRAEAPIGTIHLYAGATPPDGFLFMQGATFDTTAYPELAAVPAFSSGVLADLRGLVPRGLDPSGNVDADGAARTLLDFQDASIFLGSLGASAVSTMFTSTLSNYKDYNMGDSIAGTIGVEVTNVSATSSANHSRGPGMGGAIRTKNFSINFMVRAL